MSTQQIQQMRAQVKSDIERLEFHDDRLRSIESRAERIEATIRLASKLRRSPDTQTHEHYEYSPDTDRISLGRLNDGERAYVVIRGFGGDGDRYYAWIRDHGEHADPAAFEGALRACLTEAIKDMRAELRVVMRKARAELNAQQLVRTDAALRA